MPELLYQGNVIAEHPTRAACIVEAFERGLVYNHGRKKHFLPGVEVRGENDSNAESVESAGTKFRRGEKPT